MNDANNINQAERKKQFADMMAELQEIAELTGRSMQLKLEITDLRKSNDPDASSKIEERKNECRALDERITELKIAFDEKYPLVDKEWDSDEGIK